MKDPIQNRQNPKQDMYITWQGKEISGKALAAMNAAVDEYGSCQAHVAQSNYGIQRQNFSNILPNTSSRPGLTRRGYDSFRPAEAVPTKIKDIIKLADVIYNKVGLIRNVIDLMADFGCQGIRISHPDKRIEKFYRNWFKKVHGKERSERFLNNLYKTANVVIRRQTAKISLKDRASLFKTMAEVDIKKIEEEKIKRREIPWRYTFLNPTTIEVVGGHLSSFTGKKIYAIRLPDHIKTMISNQNLSKEEKKLVAELPAEIKLAAKSNKLVILPQDKTLVFYYKKDDWQDWAMPMTYPIMDDIIALEKLKLADSAALDGAISNIRIFKLGNLEHKIAPSVGAAAKLKNMLQSHVGAGTIDMVWGPDIEMIESKTDVHKFLGSEKYIPVMNSIHGGMGVPPTLTGSFSAGGTTNNFISLKTLIQRLQYGRDVLASFWEHELEIIQKAMGFAEPASVEFDYSSLGDEQSKNSLLLQMSDRNLISDELFQESVKHNTRLESIRINREEKERANSERPMKASPFHEAQPDIQLNRIALQSGQLTPEQTGLEFEGESKDPAQLRASQERANQQGVPQQGRPQGSNDKTKRKTKQFSPRTKASDLYQKSSVSIWATEAQEKIAETLNPAILHSFGKKTMRGLTVEQHQIAEKIKLGVLFSIDPYSSLAEKNIVQKFQEDKTIKNDIINDINYTINRISSVLDRKLTLSELHKIYSDIYSENSNV